MTGEENGDGGDLHFRAEVDGRKVEAVDQRTDERGPGAEVSLADQEEQQAAEGRHDDLEEHRQEVALARDQIAEREEVRVKRRLV